MVVKAVKVTRKGQITLPVELRKEFGIEEGDVVYVRKGSHGIEIVRPGEYAARTAGVFRTFADKRPPLEPQDIRDHAAKAWTDDAASGLDIDEDDRS